MKKGFIKLLSVILCILMCTTLCAPLTFAQGTQPNRSLYLQNTYSKIMAGETVNIAYFGGSVTNGYAGNDANGVSQNCQSATDGRDCWREATFKWFESTFADTGATFVENHCAIGGTGTDLNLYRAKNALKLGTEDAADLVFIEFAINDVFEGLTLDKSAEYMEAIVRQIYASDPYTDIVFVIVTGSDQKSTKYANALGHEKIAKAYNIPCIWVGARLYNYISGLDGGVDENFYSYFADGCHPNVHGHAKYTEYIKNDLLIPCLTGDNIPATKKVKKIMPAPLYDGGYWNSYEKIAGAESTGFSGYGFTNSGSKLKATVGGGDSFNVKFYGTGFGLRYTASDTNGLLQYNIDGGEYQAKNFRNPGSNGGTNISMLTQGLAPGWHEINVILRKTASGSDLSIDSFLVDGDPKQQAFIFGTPPSTTPNTDIYVADIVLTPELLNTVIGGVNAEGVWNGNKGSTFTVEESIIDDVKTLTYVPNQSSSDTISSDCYNSTFKSVSIPEYKYITVGYRYVVPAGVTPSASRMMMRLFKLPITPASIDIYSGQSAHKVNESDELIFDITQLAAKGMDGNLAQMHFFPMGNIRGANTTAGEKMYIKNVIFHAEYPYDTAPVALDLTDAVASGATVSSATKDSLAVTKVTANGSAALSFADISNLEMFPSVYNYAQVEYYAESGEGTPVLRLPTLDNGEFTATASSQVKTGEWRTAVFNLSDIAKVNGQWNFYKDAVLYPYGESESNGTMYIKSIKFFNNYPDPDAQFTVKFDLNGGSGTAPASVTGKIGSEVTLSKCSASKDGFMFAGWSTDKNATEALTKYYVPEYDSTLYAVWIEPPVVFASATDTTITYDGTENDVEYTTLASAVSALGTNGGTVVMTGDFAFTDINSIAQNGNGIKIIGADNTARLTGYRSGTAIKAPITLENLTVVKSGDPYLYVGNYKFEVGKGVKFITETTDSTTGNVTTSNAAFKLLGNATSGNIDFVFSSDDAIYDIIAVMGYTGGNFNGTSTITINGGTFAANLQMGNQNGAGTVSGNANLIVNGGTIQRATVNFRNYQTGTGARTLIYNNGMATASNIPNTTNFDYVIKSGVGGAASITTQATATTAPTFTLKAADPGYEIKLNGTSVGYGEYSFTPSSTGTYTVEYVPNLALTFDANGGTGTAPETIRQLTGTEIKLPTTVELSKDGYVFCGWSETADHKVILGDTYTMGTTSKTLYAVWQKADELYVNPDNSGKVTVDGIEYVAKYSSLATALSALGSNGGTAVFTGEHAFTSIGSVSQNGNGVRIVGADNTARLTGYRSGTTIKAPITLENLTVVKSGDPYLYVGNYKFEVGKGVKVITETTDSTTGNVTTSNAAFKLLGNAASGNIDFVFSSDDVIYDIVSVLGYTGTNFNGTSTFTINGGIFAANLQMGNQNGAGTVSGNANLIINGGTIQRATVIFRNYQTGTGARTLIYNNGMATASNIPNTTNFDYVIKSAVGGKVSISTQATATTAPTFTIKAEKPGYEIKLNGVSVGFGEYSFTPSSTGTYTVEYVVQ